VSLGPYSDPVTVNLTPPTFAQGPYSDPVTVNLGGSGGGLLLPYSDPVSVNLAASRLPYSDPVSLDLSDTTPFEWQLPVSGDVVYVAAFAPAGDA
jgi:hypothetical protein